MLLSYVSVSRTVSVMFEYFMDIVYFYLTLTFHLLLALQNSYLWHCGFRLNTILILTNLLVNS